MPCLASLSPGTTVLNLIPFSPERKSLKEAVPASRLRAATPCPQPPSIRHVWHRKCFRDFTLVHGVGDVSERRLKARGYRTIRGSCRAPEVPAAARQVLERLTRADPNDVMDLVGSRHASPIRLPSGRPVRLSRKITYFSISRRSGSSPVRSSSLASAPRRGTSCRPPVPVARYLRGGGCPHRNRGAVLRPQPGPCDLQREGVRSPLCAGPA